MITEQACPSCGSTDLIRTVPEKDPFNVMVICNKCQRVISGKDTTSATRAPKRDIEEKTIQLCLNMGLIYGIRYYLSEMHKLPGNEISLSEAKQAVEAMVEARGLTSAIKKPNKNGCVIALILLLLIIASIIFFFTHR
ncbi:hypothetical protein CLV51_1021026 [Chitinophaga niastensis]|uniref:Uncharacterized protein n=1 Tax=Chitinophaga niastensis TaxID=536980 RepID=A0A2P8HPK6_CHINA|nr:hypothetical protein [Chitinophaga niastensis]PSL48163.1 hypothetical protein CLV51_1021026 [Chitinophaga niastensis]